MFRNMDELVDHVFSNLWEMMIDYNLATCLIVFVNEAFNSNRVCKSDYDMFKPEG